MSNAFVPTLLRFALLLQLAAIWVAHVGFDRLLGYGLKSAAGFGFTHLGRKGKAARQTAGV